MARLDIYDPDSVTSKAHENPGIRMVPVWAADENGVVASEMKSKLLE
jgi:hypothetical protein